MNVLFAGTPEIAVESLRALADSSHELVGVLTAPDRPSGRGRALRPSPVKALALELGAPVLGPERLDAGTRRRVEELRPDVLACFAYGKIFGPRFLELFAFGGVNVHPSLLPRHRGPAPIPAAILAGDTQTGVSVQRVASEMDAGDVLDVRVIPLSGSETTASLSEIVASLGGRLLVGVLDRLEAGTIEPRPQDHAAATYSGLVQKSDGRIDWRRSAVEIDRMVRAYTPWPHAYTSLRGERLVVLESASLPSESHPDATGEPVPGRVLRVDTSIGILVETGDGLLALRKLQLPSRKPLDWRSFLNGVPEMTAAVLGGS